MRVGSSVRRGGGYVEVDRSESSGRVQGGGREALVTSTLPWVHLQATLRWICQRACREAAAVGGEEGEWHPEGG